MLRKIASVFVNNLMVYALGLAYTVLTARLLGPGQRGLLVVAVLVPTWLATLSQLGLPQSLVYNLSRIDREPDALMGAVAISLRATVLATALSILAFVGLAHSPLLKGMPPSVIVGSVVLCQALVLEAVASNILAGLQDFGWRNAVSVTRPLMTAVGLGWFYLRARRLVPLEAVELQAIGAGCAAVVGFAVIVFRHGARLRFKLPERWRANYLVYGLKFYLATVANAINYRLDALIVNAQLGSREVGLYSIAVGACELLLFVPISVTFVFYPKIASVREEMRDRMTLVTLGVSLYVVVVGALIMEVVVPRLITMVFGPAFAGGIPAAHWLLPGMIALTVVRILSYASAGLGRPEHATYATIIGVGGTIPLDLLLIPRMGIVGAAMASTIAYSLSAISILVLFVRLRKLTVPEVLDGLFIDPARWLRRTYSDRQERRRTRPRRGDVVWVRNPQYRDEERRDANVRQAR